jgi:acyl carrier protein
MTDLLLKIINKMKKNKGEKPIETISEGLNLRNDIGFDSFDLAELTVRIEKETGIDVFEDGIVTTVGEILQKIQSK